MGKKVKSIPYMNYDAIINLTHELHENNYYLDEPDILSFSFSNLRFIEPAGAILFLSTIDKLEKEQIPYGLEPLGEVITDGVSYGINMGIFQYLGLSNASSYTEGSTYIAPKKVILKDLFNDLKIQEKTIETYYDNLSSKIVQKSIKGLSYQSNAEVEDLFAFVVREMIRNIFDHSKTSHFYYGLQLYPKRNSVEVVISDLGVGLLETVPFDIEYRWFNNPTDEDAIHQALIPGLSAYSNHEYAPEDYKNSGYGLTLVRKIIEKTKGQFCIASGKKTISFHNSGEVVKDCDIRGTLIRMKINLDNLHSVDFDKILKEAQEEANEQGHGNPSTASKKLKSQRL